MTSACQTPHSTLQPVRAITAGSDIVPKGTLSAQLALLFSFKEDRGNDKGRTNSSKALIPGSAQVKSASKKQASGVNEYFLLAPKRCQKSMGGLETA